MVDDNKKLANLCQEQEHSLYLAGQEKAKLSKKLNDDQANINNLNSKLRIHDSNLNNLQNQLDKSNELNMKLKNDLQNLEDAYRNFSLDNQTMNDELNKQHSLKEDEEKNNTQLKLVLGDRKNKLRTLNEDYIYLKNLQDKACEDRNMLQMETGKLEEHIITLTKQNEKLSDEIAKVINEDNQMKDILNRSERMSIMLKSNDSILSQMPQELLNASNCFDNSKCQIPCDENNNRTNLSQERQRSLSPKFTYSRIDKNLGN